MTRQQTYQRPQIYMQCPHHVCNALAESTRMDTTPRTKIQQCILRLRAVLMLYVSSHVMRPFLEALYENASLRHAFNLLHTTATPLWTQYQTLHPPIGLLEARYWKSDSIRRLLQTRAASKKYTPYTQNRASAFCPILTHSCQMSHPFKAWYDFGGVTEQELQQEKDVDELRDYFVEDWDKDWETSFWEKAHREVIEGHVGEDVEEQPAPIELGITSDPTSTPFLASSVSSARNQVHAKSPPTVFSKRGIHHLDGGLEQTLFEDDSELALRPAKRFRGSFAVMEHNEDKDESDSDVITPAAPRRSQPTQPFKISKSKQKMSRADSKLDLAKDESESEQQGSFSSQSRSAAPLVLVPLAPPTSRNRSRVPRSQAQKDAILQMPKERRPTFSWYHRHNLTCGIMEEHLGLTRKVPQDERDGERIFSFLFADDVALSRQKAGSKSWAKAIYNSYGQKDRTSARRRWDPVQAAIEAPAHSKPVEYTELVQKVRDAANQLNIQSRLPPGNLNAMEEMITEENSVAFLDVFQIMYSRISESFSAKGATRRAWRLALG
ncbi:uncharacterized protein MYCFIDRAFT_177232 [Pseudocercospora fijiensis CIRAD86]|uniref:Uncharacterized protein n=1 Tax=Pseudocercospora fijiensis (strain CIRAD86) TaxID=383855 RepID=M2YRF1_PSEFD|nr:uncharacterized protein MYCFIDRAFT_177232 [Pseudocercospora fijiensis CIRAD86]EME80270.1 hypothetical protein MYCFIDRAFT_177232 [Pseudocercospora fijiensis CIRAD86]